MPDIESLFSSEEKEAHDFSGAPHLVRRRTLYPPLGGVLRPLEDAAWSRYQDRFIRSVSREKRFERDAAVAARDRYADYFERKALLAGNVLDVGGGTGVFRQWWTGGNAELYVVHEPVPKRPAVPSAAGLELYERAFGLPLAAVEGVGEFLPYRDQMFDTSLIAAVLDHVKSPQRVLEEVYRCLRPGGRLVLVQQCEGRHGVIGLNDLQFESAAWQNRFELVRLGRIYWDLTFHKGHHIWHFTGTELRKGLLAIGYRDISVSVLNEEKNYVVVEARR